MSLSQQLTIQTAAERVASLTHSTRGFGVRAAVWTRAILIELDREGILEEETFIEEFKVSGGDALGVAQVRQFVSQVVANRTWLVAS